jgi:hypothetical protein
MADMRENDPEREERRRRRRERREAWQRAWEAAEDGLGARKERVLHTRVSDRLAEDIRKVAEDLRVPVSNVVRNVLEDVFSVVGAVTDNVGDLIEEVVEEADRAREKISRRGWRSSERARESWQEPREEPREEARSEPPPDLPEFADVLGWQPLILNASQSCAACDRSLERGDRAFVGLGGAGLSSTYLCRRCARAVSPT